LYWVLGKGNHSLADYPIDLGSWILSLLNMVHDMDKVDGMIWWRIEEIFKTVPKPKIHWLLPIIDKRKILEATLGYAKYHALSRTHRLSKFIEPLNSNDATDSKIQEYIQNLIDLAIEPGTIGFYLPPYLLDIDPDGLVLPQQIAGQINMVGKTSLDGLLHLARLASVYSLGSDAWKIISKPAIILANQMDEKERRMVYSELLDHGSKVYSTNFGEVAVLFREERDAAKVFLEAEPDPEQKQFWEWYHARTEAQLKIEEEEAKEDRGE
jgi:hypothetical protein